MNIAAAPLHDFSARLQRIRLSRNGLQSELGPAGEVMQFLRRLPSPLLAMADQALLSVVSLATSLVFIRFGAKAEYGLYALLLTPITLVVGIMNAIVTSPTMTLYPGAGERRGEFMATAWLALLWLLAGAFVLAALGLCAAAFFMPSVGPVGPWAIGSFSVAMVGTAAREAGRSFAYSQAQVGQALIQDVVYGAVMLLGLAGLAYAGKITGWTAFAITGLAGGMLLVRGAARRPWRAATLSAWQAMWHCGRWALPGVLITWVNLNAYLLIAGHLLGVEAVADINASRLFLMPVLLGITVWSNLYRPRLSQCAAQGNVIEMRQIIRSSGVQLTGILIGYVSLLLLAYPFIEPLLGSKYRGLETIVCLWGVFALLTGVRAVFMAVLMTQASGYRQLTLVGFGTMFIAMVALGYLSPRGAAWVVAALCVVELVQLLVIARCSSYYLAHLAPRT